MSQAAFDRFKIDPSRVKVKASWSIHAGAYQVWFDVDDPGVEGLSALTTPSFYMDEVPEGLLPTNEFMGFVLSDPLWDLFFVVDQDGSAEFTHATPRPNYAKGGA